jgi:hypothetical protein
MRLGPVWLMSIAVCMTGSAFAQEVTPATPATPAASTPQPATPAPPPADAKITSAEVAQPAAAAAASNPIEGKLDADKIMAAQKAGYKIKNENGQTLLCRRELQTGSHTRYRTSCMTPQEWDMVKTQNEQTLKAIERRPRMSNQ